MLSLRLAIPTRTFATILPRTPSRTPRKAFLDLDHFLQRQRVLALYRTIVRATNQIPDPNTRKEMRSFAREEFERNRGVQDLTHVRYLVSTGKDQFKTMQRYVDELVGR
ncbi:hypothetical protein MMC34_005565 [Xylographa carneopallida]|nr:hypothetical protein [Xylographa carneopallida]